MSFKLFKKIAIAQMPFVKQKIRSSLFSLFFSCVLCMHAFMGLKRSGRLSHEQRSVNVKSVSVLLQVLPPQ